MKLSVIGNFGFKEKFLLKQGDLLYIKKENVHQSISITPRIVFSLGVRNDVG